MENRSVKKICLVTEELAGIQGSGGIGAAFSELADLLSKNSFIVDILYCPISPLTQMEKTDARRKFLQSGIRIKFLDVAKFCHQNNYEAKSYVIYQELKNTTYDVVHFHDFKGLGFATTSAKKQGLAFKDTKIVVQMHGPTRWTIDTNKTLFIHEDQVKIDFMEREAVRKADYVVSPSQYLLDYLIEKLDFVFPENTKVIKNNCQNISKAISDNLKKTSSVETDSLISEIVFFGRHEDRKGFSLFVSAINQLRDYLTQENITITFLGKLGKISGQPSGVVLAEKAKNWLFPVKIYTNLDRDSAAKYLSSTTDKLVVIPSEENSPYTVLEAMMLHKPIITSSAGGAKELIDKECHLTSLYEHEDSKDLSIKIKNKIEKDNLPTVISQNVIEIGQDWLNFHKNIMEEESHKFSCLTPKVTVGITHFERPNKLIDSVNSILSQSYKNIELIIVDDGSARNETKESLSKIEDVVKSSGGKIIYQENKYLGAARNTVVKHASGDYICFLDDDDIAFPNMIEMLVKAAVNSGEDIINCCNIFMDESRRNEGIINKAKFAEKISYIPLGGPISLAPLQNIMGSATALISSSYFKENGGYTELYGVGYEDYEFFFKALQNGVRIEVVPEPLYLYEVGRPSMISSTSLMTSAKRVFDSIDGDCVWAKDLLNLNTGKASNAHVDNRIFWQYKNSPYSEFLLPLLNDTLTHKETIEKLAGFSLRIGALNIAYSFLNSDVIDDLHVSKNFLFHKAKSEKKFEIKGEGLLFEIKYQVLLKRYDDALSELVEFCSQYFLTKEFFESLYFLSQSENDNFDFHLVNRLFDLVFDLATEIPIKDEMYESLANLLTKTAPRYKAETLALKIKDIEEEMYLDKYEDLFEAKVNGRLESPFQHFISKGLSEGRNAFPISLRLNVFFQFR